MRITFGAGWISLTFKQVDFSEAITQSFMLRSSLLCDAHAVSFLDILKIWEHLFS